MLVGVSNTFYLIIIISRFIHISSCVMCQCWHPLILVLSCFRRQVSLYQQLNWGTSFTPVNFHVLLFRDGNPNNVTSLGLRDRIPSENWLHSSWKLSSVSRDRPADGGNIVTCCLMLAPSSRTARLMTSWPSRYVAPVFAVVCYNHWPLWTGEVDLTDSGWLKAATRRHYVAGFIVTSFSWWTFIYWKNNNTCLMGDAILRIPRDARVRAYRTRDTYDGVVPATSKRQPYCHSSYIELSGYNIG